MPLNKPTIINIGDGFTIEEKLNQTEILRYALENNIIDLSYVQEKIEMVNGILIYQRMKMVGSYVKEQRKKGLMI